MIITVIELLHQAERGHASRRPALHALAVPENVVEAAIFVLALLQVLETVVEHFWIDVDAVVVGRHEVFLQQEIAEVDSWRIVTVPPGLVVDDLPRRPAALAESLKEFFAIREGTGRYCAVDAYRLPGAAPAPSAGMPHAVSILRVSTKKQLTDAQDRPVPLIETSEPIRELLRS